jgi:geranylgeranyl diphosphate synthase type II
MYSASKLLDLINSYLAHNSYTRPPRGLYEPIEYILSLGGKRLRPTLLLLAYNLYKEEVGEALGAATAIEIYHNFSLLHDDLMDRSDLRRGRLTVHRKWNDNAAILSGDAMMVLAYQYLTSSSISAELLREALPVFSDAALGICEGQQMDMEFETRSDVTVDEYINMIRLKTGVLIAAALKLGATVAQAPKEDAELLYNAGMNAGLAFQLQDDLLDVYGDPLVFGKKVGGDILCNKKTFILITALRMADAKQALELQKWLDATEYEPEEKIAAVTAIYNQLGVKEICSSMIQEYYDAAMDNLDKVNVPAEKKQELRKAIEKLMGRKV